MEDNEKPIVEGTTAFLERVNLALMSVNACNFSLLRYSDEEGLFCYQMKYETLNVLFNEINDFLNDKERKECSKQTDQLYSLVYELSPHKYLSRWNSQDQPRKVLHVENWKKIRTGLYEYEKLIRSLLSKYEILGIKKDKKKGEV